LNQAAGVQYNRQEFYMKRFSIVTFIIFTIALTTQFCNAGIKADWSPLEIGIFPPVQIFSNNTDIVFLRLSALYTVNKAAYGFDFGVVNRAEDSIGLQAAVANINRDTQGGIGVGIINNAGGSAYGLQIGMFNNTGSRKVLAPCSTASGMQLGWLNISKSIFSGIQLGLVNLSSAVFNGVQIGFVNSDRDHNNFDKVLGYKDKVDQKHDWCVQIGFLNFNEDGFLPIFPIINF
jgi:hypothetical protein